MNNIVSALDFLDVLDDENKRVNICGLNQPNLDFLLHNLVYHERNSRSLAEILLADLVSNIEPGAITEIARPFISRNCYLPVVMKVFPDFTDDQKSDPLNIRSYSDESKELFGLTTNRIRNYIGLSYEIEVYQFISREILPSVSPNFIGYIASRRCTFNEVRQLFSREVALLVAAHSLPQGSISSIYDVNPGFRYSILITERAGNGARFGRGMAPIVNTLTVTADILRNLHETRQITGEEYERFWDEIVFQLVWSIAALVSNEITHNDLHSNNILVALFDEPIELEYRFLQGTVEKRFTLRTKFVPYIFDLDYAQARTLFGDNSKLYNYPALNALSFSPTRDLYTLFCSIGWAGRIARTYYTQLTRMSESEERIGIGPEEYLSVRELYNVFNGLENVYSLTRNQLEDVIGEQIDYLPNLDNFIIELHSDSVVIEEDSKCYITIAKPSGTRCRTMQTDPELLHSYTYFTGTYFDRFLNPTIDGALNIRETNIFELRV
jgi:hypothetical protein